MRLFPKKSRLTVYASDGAKTEVADLSVLDYEFTVAAKLPRNKKGKNHTEPVRASVIVRGLSESTRAKIEASQTGIRIEYGYGDDLYELFEGRTVNTFSVFEGPGWRTEIFAKHSWDAYKNSYFSRSYEGDTPVKTALEDVLKSFGIPYTNRYSRDDSLIGGAVFDGESKDIMDRLCADWDMSWRVENDAITVEDALNPPLVDRTRVVILGPSVIGGPVVDDSLESENRKNERVVRRVSATSILLPQLWPGVPVRFDVRSFARSSGAVGDTRLSDFASDSIYICDTVEHRGSSMAVQCTTDITTKEVSA